MVAFSSRSNTGPHISSISHPPKQSLHQGSISGVSHNLKPQCSALVQGYSSVAHQVTSHLEENHSSSTHLILNFIGKKEGGGNYVSSVAHFKPLPELRHQDISS